MTPLQPPEVLFADVYNRPVFQMGPHDATAMGRNLEVLRSGGVEPADWAAVFGGDGVYTATVNGREAIALALADLGLTGDDEVMIVTTSGGPYISNCVTEAIDRRCRWSRALGPKTRAVFLIHEFGFPAALPPEVAAASVPVIEDCAYGLGTAGSDGAAGGLGDYVIWSFSKAFPMAYGGLLKTPGPIDGRSALSSQASRELPILAGYYLATADVGFARRRDVFELYRQRFAAEGFAPLFEPVAGVTPHSFVVAMPDQAKAEAMKPLLQATGVISSVFYGGGGYFLPNHQALSDAAVDYIAVQFMAAWREVNRL